MAAHHRAIAWFGLTALATSLPVAWAFWGLSVPGSMFGAHLWGAMPALAVAFAMAAAYLVMNLAPSPRFGFWRGALAALIALIACAAIAHPVLVLPALVFVAWFVVPIGAIAGFMLRRWVLHPNPPVNADARDVPPSTEGSGARAGHRARWASATTPQWAYHHRGLATWNRYVEPT